jgi:hypothetical protein
MMDTPPERRRERATIVVGMTLFTIEGSKKSFTIVYTEKTAMTAATAR